MSQYQKQTLLDTLTQYTTSGEALKAVMNSPGVDKRGSKILSSDGTKAIFSNQNGFRNSRGKNNPKKGSGEQKKSPKGNQGQGSSGKSTQGQPKAKKTKTEQVFNLNLSQLN